MVEIVTSARARRDLRAIYRYGVRHFGSEQAIRYLDDLTDAIYHIADDPEIGAVYRAQGRVEIRRFVHLYHSVFYVIDGDVAIIVRVLSGRARVPKRFDVKR